MYKFLLVKLANIGQVVLSHNDSFIHLGKNMNYCRFVWLEVTIQSYWKLAAYWGFLIKWQ